MSDFDDGYMPEPDGSELACPGCDRLPRLADRTLGGPARVYVINHKPDCEYPMVEQQEAEGPPDFDYDMEEAYERS